MGEKGRYVFEKNTTFEGTRVSVGTSVEANVATDSQGEIGLFTEEPIFTDGAIIPKGVKLVDLNFPKTNELKPDERMIVTTAIESFTLLITVSLYSAIAFSMPFYFCKFGDLSLRLYISTNENMSRRLFYFRQFPLF